MSADYLQDQDALFGQPLPCGFGDDAFCVREISRDVANDIIKKNHYSGTVVANSTVHLGVYATGELLGALQFGYAMNPASGSSIVSGSTADTFLELNRMWLSDDLPRNSESRAISYAIKWLRRARRQVEWVQSFADERCGKLGVVYQASNFMYCGEHIATFWELDGEWFHNIAMTCKSHEVLRTRPEARKLQARRDEAVKHTFRQFRYLYFIKQQAKKRLLLPTLPYPKTQPTLEVA